MKPETSLKCFFTCMKIKAEIFDTFDIHQFLNLCVYLKLIKLFVCLTLLLISPFSLFSNYNVINIKISIPRYNNIYREHVQAIVSSSFPQ